MKYVIMIKHIYFLGSTLFVALKKISILPHLH